MLKAVILANNESFAGRFAQFFLNLLQHFLSLSRFEQNRSNGGKWENSDLSIWAGNSRSKGLLCALHSGAVVLSQAAMVKLSVA